MKNRLLMLIAITSCLLAQNHLASAQILVNGDFEKSAGPVRTNKVTTGFAAIPGWKNIGGTANDSGVQYGTPGDGLNCSQAGSYFAFQKSDDSTGGDGSSTGVNKGAYQITNTLLHTGDRITLTWYAVNTNGNPVQNVSLLAAPSANASFAAATVLTPGNRPTLDLSASYTKYTIQYTATAADASKYLGVSFSTTGDVNSYAQYDSFVVTADSAPSP